MDIIRYRERHGVHHIGAEIDPELLGAPGFVNSMPPSTPPPMLVRAYDAALSASARTEIRSNVERIVAAWHPLAERLKQPFSTFTYYVGFLTTLLVVVAWTVNLFFKPAATVFGGGITLLGVSIAVVHYRYLQRSGTPAVFLDIPALLPNAWLVVLSPGQDSKKVIEAAIESAGERARPLAFLYLAPKLPDRQPPRLFEIRDRFGHDRAAQKVLSYAKRLATQRRLNVKFYYAVGGPKQVFDIARRIRPDEIVAEASLAKQVSHGAKREPGMTISPDYVRYQQFDGISVAHYVLHQLYAHVSDPGAPDHSLPNWQSPQSRRPSARPSDASPAERESPSEYDGNGQDNRRGTARNERAPSSAPRSIEPEVMSTQTRAFFALQRLQRDNQVAPLARRGLAPTLRRIHGGRGVEDAGDQPGLGGL